MQYDEKIKVASCEDICYKYLVYKPKKIEDKKYPLIVFLHGAGERGEELPILKVHSVPKFFEQDVDYPCFVVSPQCRENSFWNAEAYQLKRFIDAIAEKYPIDKNRIHLTGVSMGGFGTWNLAMAYPDMFASLVPICGGGMPWNASVLKMPIRIFHGEADPVVSVRESIDMYEALKNTNSDVEITILPGVGHNAWDYAYNEETFNWMLSQSK